MSTSNTARRVVPLRGRGARNVSQSRTKKPTPSFPTADQVEQVISQLQTLVSTGEAEKVDGELKRLLQALGLDPASPAAWRDGFLLFACLHYDVGKPRRTNKNAEKLSAGNDWVLLHEVIRLKDQGLNEAKAIEKLASDPSKADLLKLKPMSSIAQRAEVLRKRLKKITNSALGWDALMGSPSVSTVEETLTNLILSEVRKNKPAF